MANEKTKKKVQVWMDPDLVAQIDGIAARDGMTRAAVLTAASELYVSGSKSQSADARLDAISAKLDALKADQVTQTALLADAIRKQPIAVQQPAELPAPEVTEADVRKYISEHCPDVELVGLFDERIRLRRKGLAARIFG